MFSSGLVDDYRWVVRGLARAPVATGAVVVSVAIGIGTTTAAFSGFNALQFKPLQVSQPEQLFQIVLGSESSSFVASPVFTYLREHVSAVGPLAAASAGRYRLRIGDISETSEVLFGSGELFGLLGVTPTLGRWLTQQDDRPGAALVGVLGDQEWRERFGSAPSAVGATVFVQGAPVTVVGVSPPAFHGVHVGRRFDIALPLAHVHQLMGLQPGAPWSVAVVGRRLDEASLVSLSARLRALQPSLRAATTAPAWSAEDEQAYLAEPLRAVSAYTGVATSHSEQAATFAILMAAAFIVLAIGCVNVAHWLLARYRDRHVEFAVRSALGAEPFRLGRMLLLESVTVVGLGVLLGAGVASGAAHMLTQALSSNTGTLVLDRGPDWRVITMSGLTALLVAVGAGLAPAWSAARARREGALSGATRSWTPMNRGTRLLAGLQLATLVVLVGGTSMLVRSFVNVTRVDPGFTPAGVWVADVLLGDRATDAPAKTEAYAALLDAVRAVPGVEAVGGASVSPVVGNAIVTRVEADRGHLVYINRVSPGYFNALRVPLFAGRDFAPADHRAGEKVAIVNEAFASAVFGARQVVGEFVTRVSYATNTRVPLRIVGVVRDTAYLSLREPKEPTLFVPLSQEPGPDAALSLIVRREDQRPPSLTELQRAVALTGQGGDVTMRPLEAQLDLSRQRDRGIATFAGALSGVALLTSMVGLYGVFARMVERRKRELGVRLALGATARRVVGLVVVDAVGVAGVGVAVGVAVSHATAPALTSLLFGVDPHDPSALLIAVSVLVATVMVACFVPARRASQVDPATTLRAD